jgi:hypothetical protein
MVMVRGRLDATGLTAGAIVVEPERFLGFIAEPPVCKTETEGLIRVIYPFKEAHRLLLAGIDLRQDNAGMVGISKETRLFGLEDKPILCANLRRGMAVRIFGRMIPPDVNSASPNHFSIKAFMMKGIPVSHVGGTVHAVSMDDRGRTVLMLGVPLDKVEGFDQSAGASCLASPCDPFNVRVLLSPRVYNPGNIIFNIDLVGQNILAAGYFMGEPGTADARASFFTTVIRKGEPQKEEISPL